MKRIYLQLIIFSTLILFSCQQNTKKETKQLNRFTNEQNSESFIFGIDISHHNNNEIDSIQKQTDSLHFIISKATEGVTYTDPKFRENWKKIKQKGYLRGAYHFYRSEDNPLAQANFFLSTVYDLENTDIPPIIDFEQGGIDNSTSIDSIQVTLLKFINEIEKKANVKPIIYTDSNTANKYLTNVIFQKYPLWIADYNGKNKPDLPIIWEKNGYLIWQKTDSYSIESTVNDFDIFNGTLTDFKEFIKKSYSKR